MTSFIHVVLGWGSPAQHEFLAGIKSIPHGHKVSRNARKAETSVQDEAVTCKRMWLRHRKRKMAKVVLKIKAELNHDVFWVKIKASFDIFVIYVWGRFCGKCLSSTRVEKITKNNKMNMNGIRCLFERIWRFLLKKIQYRLRLECFETMDGSNWLSCVNLYCMHAVDDEKFLLIEKWTDCQETKWHVLS